MNSLKKHNIFRIIKDTLGIHFWQVLELEAYYNYTCREGDYIKTCTVPSPKLDETDLEREKKMLTI